jgi:hypothetical protein
MSIQGFGVLVMIREDLSAEELDLYLAIRDHYQVVHDELTSNWLSSGKKRTAKFKTDHDNNWKQLESELEYQGLLVPEEI